MLDELNRRKAVIYVHPYSITSSAPRKKRFGYGTIPMMAGRINLISFANEARKKASELPPGPPKIELLRKARQADSAARLEKWVNSLGLQPPD